MRAAPPLMIDEGFARKFVELGHDYHRACLLGLIVPHDEGKAGGNASFWRSLLISPLGVNADSIITGRRRRECVVRHSSNGSD